MNVASLTGIDSYCSLSCPITVSFLVYKPVMLSTMHTRHHLVQWPRSVVVRQEHNHPPDPAQTTTHLAIEGMRKRAREESTSINMIYDDQLHVLSQEDNSADVLAQLPSLESVRSSLYRARHENTPTLPTQRRDVSLSSRFTKIHSGEDFLLVDDGTDDKILIFATEENIRLMSDANAFYIDGTFSTCPSLFYQVCDTDFF